MSQGQWLGAGEGALDVELACVSKAGRAALAVGG